MTVPGGNLVTRSTPFLDAVYQLADGSDRASAWGYPGVFDDTDDA